MKDYLQKKQVNNLDCEKTEKKLLHSLQKVLRKKNPLFYFNF